MDYTITTIPARGQRYQTVGDWQLYPSADDPILSIRVSKMGDRRYEFLVAIHELIEAFLCTERGITPETVDAFDYAWHGDGEPGDDPRAPYHREHEIAGVVERLVAHELGVDWQAYEQAVDTADLDSKKEKE